MEAAMRLLSTVIIAGIGSLALAGSALAQTTHTMNVRLPDGSLEQIQYSGNTPPRVEITPAPTFAPVIAVPAWAFGPPSPFAEMQRIVADANREAAVMWRQAAALAAQPLSGSNGAISIDLAHAPAGTQVMTFSARYAGNGVCTTDMEVTSIGPHGTPHVISHRSGDCGGPHAARSTQPEPKLQNPLLQARQDGAGAFGVMHKVAWNTTE
jgi:hypothetical protein